MFGYDRDDIEGIGISVELINNYNKMQSDRSTLAKQGKPTKGQPRGSGQPRARKISHGPQRSRMKHLPKTRRKK